MGKPILKVFGKAWHGRAISWMVIIAFCLTIATLPLWMSIYFQSMTIKVLIFGLFALSLNLLFGYTGLFSLGHAAYFGVAGYTVAILITRFDISSFWLAAPAGVLMGVLMSAVFGVIALRLAGVYFLAVTAALGELLYSLTLKLRSYTGGANGLPGISYPDLGLPGFSMTNISFYYLVFSIFIICCILIYYIIHSSFGLALQGIREDEERMESLGYNTWVYKYLAFILGGLFGAVAGVLFAYFNGIVTPSQLSITTSTLAMLMVMIGSDRTTFGPALGALVIILVEHLSGTYTPTRWPLILGGILVLTVMFLRGGISIHLVKFWDRVKCSYGSNQD